MIEKKELNILVRSNIKREREKARLTQDQFAEMLGIGSKSLSAIERGVVGISLSTLLKICDVLSISSNSLLFENSHKNDVRSITERLETLSPEQFEIVNDVLRKVLAAFTVSDQT